MSVKQSSNNINTKTKNNYSATAHIYITDTFECPEQLQGIYNEVKRGLTPKALVIGCGPADDAATLTLMGFSVIAIDNSPGMVNEAKIRNPIIDVREMSMTDAGNQFLEGEFDLVLAHYSLFHERKENLPYTIAGFAKVLQPNGFIYLTTQESMTGTPMETTSQRSDDNQKVYINAETEESLRKLLPKVGIEVFFSKRREPTPEEHQFFKLTMCGKKVATANSIV